MTKTCIILPKYVYTLNAKYLAITLQIGQNTFWTTYTYINSNNKYVYTTNILGHWLNQI